MTLLYSIFLSLVLGTSTNETTGIPFFPEGQYSPVPSGPDEEKRSTLTAHDIQLSDSLLYDKYTLQDQYLYNKQERSFKWEQIQEKLALIENMQQDERIWGVIQNYKNRNRESPLVKKFARNKYGRVADTLGTERYQSAPLYAENDTIKPTLYGRDGALYHLCAETGKFYLIEDIQEQQRWYVPKRYLRLLADSTVFHHVVVVDRKDQNIATLERYAKGKWWIRSKNPATTGRNKPPYAQPTPLGIFLIQEQKKRMIYLKDGSAERGGFAPYASRFTCGAYVHGIPVQAPKKSMIEYSWSLGTTPRSHMCVRSATSHAKFIYEWAPLRQSLVLVIE